MSTLILFQRLVQTLILFFLRLWQQLTLPHQTNLLPKFQPLSYRWTNCEATWCTYVVYKIWYLLIVYSAYKVTYCLYPPDMEITGDPGMLVTRNYFDWQKLFSKSFVFCVGQKFNNHNNDVLPFVLLGLSVCPYHQCWLIHRLDKGQLLTM